ncbi:LexA family protein [Cupriavidus basilensis]|uniref:LexA family protein n=1 Tax=Cupriavidus basilensis TaxID=68895 RepID=UPI0039F6BA1A
MATVQKRALSADEIADAARLDAAWKAYKEKCAEKGERPSQEWLGSVTKLGKQSVIGQYLRGAIPLNLKALLAICAAIGARPSDISPRLTKALNELTGPHQVGENPTIEGRSASGASAYNPPTGGDNFELGPDIRPRRYPEISWVQAGMWTEICDNFVAEEGVTLHACPYDLGPCGYVLRVKGQSMTGAPESKYSFPEDTLLFVNPDLEVMPGKFVIVARNGNEATFKRLTSIDDQLFLEAMNPSWPLRFTPLEREHHFCGVVVFSGRPL